MITKESKTDIGGAWVGGVCGWAGVSGRLVKGKGVGIAKG